MTVEARYADGSYLAANPDWDRQDAPWKAAGVVNLLGDHDISPLSICEVGCGSGEVLAELALRYSNASMAGFDVSPQLAEFWDRSRRRVPEDGRIEFHVGEFSEINTRTFDVLLMLDVFEHVRDPFSLLESARPYASHFVFHIPLDLSATSIVRRAPLMEARRKVGHLHFYTRDLALELLRDCGYSVVEARYTGASLSGPNRSWKTRLASVPRRLAYAVDRDLGVRLLGGETLLVLAVARDCQ